MSCEQQDYAQEINQFALKSLKIQNQNTTIYLRHKNTAQVTSFDFQSYPSLTQCSFEQGIYQENMQILKNASIRYLEDSLVEPFDKSEGFKNENLYENLPFEVGGSNELEVLITCNQLLTENQQYQFIKILKQEEEIIRLVKQIISVFGITVGKQLIYIFYHILNLKLEKFRNLASATESIIPKFDCFQGYQDQLFFLKNSCPVYQDLNLQEICVFAEKELENIYSNLYFSNQIKYLSLRDIKSDTQGNILARFSHFVKQISRTLFFTLAGACQPNEPNSGSLFFIDLSREVSFSELPETLAPLAIMKRAQIHHPEDQEQYDFLTKKVKFQ